jgi:hypothetical protein
MATVAVSQRERQPWAAGMLEHILRGMALALTVFVGFAPTYYLRVYFGKVTDTGATSLSTLAQIHGAVCTGWVL